ncbi:MAG: DUF5518 domain-containing protein [Halosimplex sp.]
MTESAADSSRPGDAWRYALAGALVSVPLIVLGFRQSGSELSLMPVVLGGVVAGYLATRESGSRRGVGPRVGVLAAVPGLWVLRDLLWATGGLGGPDWFVTAGLLFAAAAAVAIGTLIVGFSVLFGTLGARIGGWLAGGAGGRGAGV